MYSGIAGCGNVSTSSECLNFLQDEGKQSWQTFAGVETEQLAQVGKS